MESNPFLKIINKEMTILQLATLLNWFAFVFAVLRRGLRICVSSLLPYKVCALHCNLFERAS